MLSLETTHTIEPRSFSGMELVSRRIVRQPAHLHLLHGHSNVFLASLMIGGATNQKIAIIDGAMKFNSYTLADIARLIGILPAALLRRTYITRSFTAFQTEAAIVTKLTRFLSHTPCPLVVILGLLETYYDEQVKAHECRQSLLRILQTLRALASRHIHVLIADVEVPNAPPGKEQLFRSLYDAVDIVLSLQPHEQKFRFNEERRNRLWGATTIPSRLPSNGIKRSG